MIGIAPGSDKVLLEPKLELAEGARSLIAYGDLRFMGCDLSLHDDRPELVTYWQNDAQPMRYQIALRFILPESETLVDIAQLLDESVLLTPLPSSFYASGRRGEIWIRVVDADSQELVPPLNSFRPVDVDGWIRVCN